MFDQTFTGPKDAPKVNTVERDGVVVKLQREDPYGLIFLTVDGVTLPEKFQGRYTDVDYAQKAAIQYIEERNQVVKEIKAEAKPTTGRAVTPPDRRRGWGLR